MRLTFDCEGYSEVHLDVLKVLVGEIWRMEKDMVDLCCGFAAQTRQLQFSDKNFIDIVDRDLAEENVNFEVRDVMEFIGCRFPQKLHSTFLLDAIEHFKKEEGKKILYWMNENSERSIVFTPLGDYLIETTETNNPDSHKSGWHPEEFEENGWVTVVFPNFHKLLGIGAFFALKCDNIKDEFKNIYYELNQKEWAKSNK